jgi:hypothetical protein
MNDQSISGGLLVVLIIIGFVLLAGFILKASGAI